MPGKVVIKKSNDQSVFDLKAANSEIIATSERHKTEAGAKNGIESHKTNGPGAARVDETGE